MTAWGIINFYANQAGRNCFMTTYILLIENDDLDQAESLLPALQEQGYEVFLSHTPELAFELTNSLWPNLIVFNSVQSSYNLTNVQEAIDKTSLNIPYIIVADKNFSTGPINPETIVVVTGKSQQLVQSVKKVTLNQKNRFTRLPGLILDGEQHQVLRDGQIYSLTPKEFKLLHLLATNHDQIISRKTIMQEVWETDYLGDTRTLDVHIRWLREKIEGAPSRPRRLITIRGVGYRFILNPE
jgi:DNA-binding response OmpR family regulator